MIAVLKAKKESGCPTMTDDEKWHAVATKDPKTDGKFYYAVKTTEGNIALQEPVSKLKGPVTDCTLLGKTFIWLPFAGGISAFAVILPKPMGTGHGVGGGYPDASHVNGCYAETLDRKSGSNFGSL